jgi:hypothetical protein
MMLIKKLAAAGSASAVHISEAEIMTCHFQSEGGMKIGATCPHFYACADARAIIAKCSVQVTS